MSKEPDLFGTDPKHLHRKEGPDTSIAAAYSVDTTGKERAVLEVIARYPGGAISDEVRSNFPKGTPYSSMTARYKAVGRQGPDTAQEARCTAWPVAPLPDGHAHHQSWNDGAGENETGRRVLNFPIPGSSGVADRWPDKRRKETEMSIFGFSNCAVIWRRLPTRTALRRACRAFLSCRPGRCRSRLPIRPHRHHGRHQVRR